MRDGFFNSALFCAALFGSAAIVKAEEEDEDQGPGPEPGVIREETYLSTYYQANALRKMAASTAVPWVSQGPYGMGRINDVEVDPTNDQIIYVGAASGGIWKSTDGGNSYAQIFNDFDQSIGAIAVDPNNPQIVWAGGGENMYGGGSLTYPGTGIFKSINGGASWQKMGLDSSFYISRIAVTPGNSNQIFVAAQGSVWGKNTYRGVYRTEDGGDTWAQVLGPRAGNITAGDDSTGAVDVRVSPTTPARVFANFFSAQRLPYARSWGGPSSRAWRSDDGGTTWTVLGAAEGLPTTDLGKSTMDICVSNPNIIYMVYFTAANTLKNIYKSTDGGLNWATLGSLNGNSAALYSYYAHTFGQIRVNPVDPNDVVVLGLSSYRSTNGGISWSRCFNGAHADHRTMAWSRANGNNVYLGDDGGLKKSTTGPNGGLTATGTGAAGMNIAQLYSLDVAPDDANYRYAGFQDNGAQYTTDGGTSWNLFVGGDGMQIRVDHGAPSNVIGALQYGAFSRSSLRGSGAAAITYPGSRKLWDAGVAIDSVSGFSYLGSEFVSRALRGSATYTQISNDLTNGDHSVANYPMGSVSAISAHNNVVFAGTDDGNVWVNQSASTGSNWTRIRNGDGTGPGTGERAYDGWIKLIQPDYSVSNGSSAFIGISYFRWGFQFWKPTIYRMNNYGLGGSGSADWQDISGDLPPRINANKVVKAANGYLYAATDYGPYFSTNGGVNWSWLGDRTSLPVVPVNDLVIHQATNTLYIGTYGRGIWSYPLDQVPPVQEKDRTLAGAGAQFLKNFPNPVSTLMRIQFQVSRPQNLFLAIYDFSGRQVRVLLDKKVDAEKAYALSWDRTNDQGAKVNAGTYILRAIGDKVTLARKVDVR